MKRIDSKDLCSYKHASMLNKNWRRRLQNPSQFLKPYIKSGMTVLDFGCGNGFCTLDIANLLNGTGQVIAADLQHEMLDLLQKRVDLSPFKQTITLHKCGKLHTGLSGHFDFMLLFWMFHEVPNQEHLLKELKPMLAAGGKILISEPKVHVSAKSFSREMELAKMCGFKAEKGPSIFFSRTTVLSINDINKSSL